MSNIELLKQQRQASIDATAGGYPARPCNPFFGVGPITDMTIDEMDSRRVQFEFHYAGLVRCLEFRCVEVRPRAGSYY